MKFAFWVKKDWFNASKICTYGYCIYSSGQIVYGNAACPEKTRDFVKLKYLENLEGILRKNSLFVKALLLCWTQANK